VCPRCAELRVTKFDASSKGRKARHLYQCADCRYQYSVTVGTLFHNSHIPLRKWFAAIWLLSNEEEERSVLAMHSILDLPYKTVWKMTKRIRAAKIEEGDYFEDQDTDPEKFNEFHGPRPLSGQIGPLEIGILGIRLQRILGRPPRLFRGHRGPATRGGL
jgi:transposase-like protein